MVNSGELGKLLNQSVSRLAIGLGIAVCMQSAVLAQPAPNTPTTGVEEIVVTGRATFLNVNTGGTTGLPIQIEKVPQSISLVSNDFLKAADLKTIGDVADYTPGAFYTGVPEGIGATIKLRGFSAGASIDGLQVREYYDPDYAVIDRLEIVKGPSSVVYGISSPGGLVNRVTKGAGPNTPNYLSAQFGSWDNWRIEGQVAQRLDDSGRVRAIGIGVYDQGNSFQHVINHQSHVIYGGIDVDLTANISAFAHVGYERNTRTAFDGIPTKADGSPAPVPRSFFIGAKEDELTTEAYYAITNATWHATDQLEFGFKALYERTSTRGTAPYSYGLDQAGNIGVALQIYDPYVNEDYGLAASALYRLDRLGLENSFVSAAALYQVDNTIDSEQTALFNGEYDTVANIFAGESAISNIIRSAKLSPPDAFKATVKTSALTLTTQSIIEPIKHLSILFGASYSDPTVDNVADGQTRKFAPGGNTIYRAGSTYEFVPGANLYVSFSQSFQPQARIDVNGNVLPPLSGDQYEAGVKWRTMSNRLLLTGAFFDIKQSNSAVFDQQLGGFDRYKAIGQVEHKGVELEALGQLSQSIQIIAGYAALEPKITKNKNASLIGKTENFLPESTGSIFAMYNFIGGKLDGLAIGAGTRFIGSQKTSYDGSTGPLKSYTVADASLSYSMGPWMAQVNIRNLFDKTYYVNNYGTLFYGNTVGTPRSVQLTVKRTF